VKRCPTCKRTFSSPSLSFCTDDGTPLVPVPTPDDEATLVRPAPRADELTDVSGYQPPGPYVPPGYAPKARKIWPWVVAILVIVFVVFAGLGIAAAIMIPRLMRETANSNSSDLNTNNQRSDSNLNANGRNLSANSPAGNDNKNSNSNQTATPDDSVETTPAPTDQDKVLGQLTDLEQDWTLANINADKTRLERILADDYVGSNADGKPQGKAEYLRTATRDTTIRKWNFEDLKLSLKADRATLTGIIQLNVRNEQGQDQDVSFTFTDKFVWRDGRWQATGSQVKLVTE
jgi:ketosteroid isomerase-like protein